MISDKVRPHHLERKAILYVRQSSAHQVLHNRESSALQYAMRDRLSALGWSEIDVIAPDLGRSAAGGVQRAGFERMVAEVCLGKDVRRAVEAPNHRLRGAPSPACRPRRSDRDVSSRSRSGRSKREHDRSGLVCPGPHDRRRRHGAVAGAQD